MSEPHEETASRQSGGPPTQGKFDRIKHDARARLAFERRKPSNLWIEESVLRAGHTIDAQHQQIPIERDTVVVFADDAPLANWGHPCRYLLYDPEHGELYRTVRAQFPPYLTKRPDSFKPFHRPVVWPRPDVLWPIYRPWWHWPRFRKGDWYAILFSGASNNRHTNDLEFLYRVLVHDYGVAKDKIYVLNYDGTINYNLGPQPVVSWPGNSTPYEMTVNGAGTKSEFENAVDDLKGRLKPQDSLLVHTNNHGGRGTDSYLVTHSGPSYDPGDFAAKLGELPKFNCLMVMMEQCFAGGFNQPIINQSPAARTSVASAAIATQSSIGGANFDPFARDWIAAMHGAGPGGGVLASNPDTNGDGRISAREAYDYADSVHDPYDTPNYSQSYTNGGRCSLGVSGSILIWPYLYLYIERWWKRPWPEALERLERIQPELSEIVESDLRRREEVLGELEERVKRALEG